MKCENNPLASLTSKWAAFLLNPPPFLHNIRLCPPLPNCWPNPFEWD
jgi:hypothetical protein